MIIVDRVLADARKEWPRIFMSDPMMSVGCNDSDKEEINFDSDD